MKPLTFPACILVLALVTGCAGRPYARGDSLENERTLKLPEGEAQFERGKPNRWLDGFGHYLFSLPSKLLLWNWRVDNHRVTPETEAVLQEYLAANGLHNVKIRVNQYAVGPEWRRLFRNKWMQPGWRYTLGVLSVAQYTIFPGRLFGGDNYNPYTNTISIYSDHTSIALHEAGHARDFAEKGYVAKGIYAGIRILPLVPLYQEAIATSETLSYDRDQKETKRMKDDYKVLYPAYGTYVGGELLRWVQVELWLQYAVQAAVVIPGHIIGRTKAAFVPRKLRADRAAEEGLETAPNADTRDDKEGDCPGSAH